MNRRITIDLPAWQVVIAVLTVFGSAAMIMIGAALGGTAYGRASAPAPTKLAERTYRVQDLVDAAEACGAPTSVVSGSTLTMMSADFGAPTRQCVVAELDAPSRAIAEYGGLGTKPEFQLDGGSYEWSNASMTWKQTDDGRDLTITVKQT